MQAAMLRIVGKPAGEDSAPPPETFAKLDGARVSDWLQGNHLRKPPDDFGKIFSEVMTWRHGFGHGARAGAAPRRAIDPSTCASYTRPDCLAAGMTAMWNWYSQRRTARLDSGSGEDGRVRLIYAATGNGERRDYSYLVRLNWTACQCMAARPYSCARRMAAGGAW